MIYCLYYNLNYCIKDKWNFIMKERKAEEFIVEEQKSDSPRINKLLSKKITLASLLIALAGCSSFDARPVPLSKKPILNTKVLVSIENNVRFKKRNQRGEALRYYDPNLGLYVCKIKLFEYPHFLGHEMDHCFRGKWHDDEKNGDDFK